MKMEPIVSSETSAIRTQTPGNYPERNNLHFYILLTSWFFNEGFVDRLRIIAWNCKCYLDELRTYITTLMYLVTLMGCRSSAEI